MSNRKHQTRITIQQFGSGGSHRERNNTERVPTEERAKDVETRYSYTEEQGEEEETEESGGSGKGKGKRSEGKKVGVGVRFELRANKQNKSRSC